MATRIDGKALAAEMQAELAEEAKALRSAGVEPTLAVVLVGEDPASQIYVGNKLRTAERLGISSRDHILPTSTSQEELMALIRSLNEDPKVHGILVQSPLPPHLDERAVLSALDPAKDVDGLTPYSMGALMIGEAPLAPCTPSGIMEMLRRTGVDLTGKEAVVVGRSDLVGKPIAMLLLHQNATVTLCHSRTRDLPAVCRRADVLVVAVGRARMVNAEYVKPGAVVIDVGINRVDGKVVGDVDFDSVEPVAAAITPVPGGVGPMTVTMLMKNTLTAARLSRTQNQV
ncbi:MAG: bifunctional methylenetetrahydrofolate dehydrogenase/methenyltetrahydrofolate cyclohydrolase FolD [Armatimonadota bacterium]